MNRFDTPLVSILFTIALMVGLYFAYQWVFEELETNNQISFTQAASERLNVGIAGDKRIGTSYSGPNVNAVGRNRRSSTLNVTGMPPTAEAFAASLAIANPQEGNAMPGNNPLLRRSSTGLQTSPEQPMVYATRTTDKNTNILGGMGGGIGSGAFFSQRRGSSESSTRPQGAMVIAQNNIETQTRPFFSGEGDNPGKLDPGTDPLSSEQIPVPDGSDFLLLFALAYGTFKIAYPKKY